MRIKEMIPIQEAPGYQTNSPCQYPIGNVEDSVENMNTNVRV